MGARKIGQLSFLDEFEIKRITDSWNSDDNDDDDDNDVDQDHDVDDGNDDDDDVSGAR